MTHAMIASIFAVLLPCMVSCVAEKDVEKNVLPVELDGKTFSGQETAGWPARIFVFEEGECIAIKDIPSLESGASLEVKAGCKISVVACKDMGSFVFSPEEAGSPAETYCLRTADSRTYNTGVRAASKVMKAGEKVFDVPLRPVSSTISVNILNAPAGFDNVLLSIPECTNTYFIDSETLVNQAAPSPGAVMPRPTSRSATVFSPMSPDQPWTPSLKVTVDKKTFTPIVAFERGLGPGIDAQFTFDFARYPADKSYQLTAELLEGTDGSLLAKVEKQCRTVQEVQRFSTNYAVYVERGGDWKKLDAYDVLCSNAAKHGSIWNDWENKRALRDTMAFCVVESDFLAPVRIRVKKLRGTFDRCEVRPSPYGIVPTRVNSSTVEFELPSFDRRKVSVEFDGDRFHNLFIYANRPYADKPSASSAGVKYFGPGFHDAGTLTLTAGQTLFLDYGAYVYGNVITEGDNVTIAGNGILSGQKMKHWGDNLYSWGDFLMCCNKTDNRARNLEIKDITMIDSPGWNMCVRTTDGVVIDGVNMISWELNGDGIDVCSCTDVEIRNCFLRNYDDNITLKCRFIINPITDVSNVTIHDCLIWNDYARGIVIGPEAGETDSGSLHDISVRDCIFLEHGNGANDDLKAAFAIGQGSKGNSNLWAGTDPPAKITKIQASNLIFDKINVKGRAAAIWQYKSNTHPVSMSDITLEDFKILGKEGNYPALCIKTNGAQISRLKVKDLEVNGTKVTSMGSQFTIDFPSNVEHTME